jgi:2',3'-cyclic-nucleotide 2'-phosphodiesterase (5'-nucleotidase family)
MWNSKNNLMQTKKYFYFLFISFILTSCTHKTWQVVEAKSEKISIDSTTEKIADKEFEATLQPVKERIDAEMSMVIGYSAENMKSYAPESPLSNFCADVFRRAASDFLHQEVDVSVVNLGGLRTEIPAGSITVRNIYELMPFENELVILWIKGDKLIQLFQFFASVGGEGVSGIRMKVKNGKAVQILVGTIPIDPAKIYTVATSDYLAEGNDQMTALSEYEKISGTGLKLRNVLIDFIRNETLKGNIIQSKIDGRISLEN